MKVVMIGGEVGTPPPSADGSFPSLSRHQRHGFTALTVFLYLLPETITGRAHGLRHAGRGEPVLVVSPDAPWDA